MIHVSLTGHGHNSIKNTIKLQVLYEVIKLGRSKIHKSPKNHFLPEPAIRFQFPTYTLAVTRKEILKIYRYRLGIAMTNGPRELSRHCTQEQKQFERYAFGPKRWTRGRILATRRSEYEFPLTKAHILYTNV